MIVLKDVETDFLLEELKNRGYIQVFWTKDDVKYAISELGHIVTPKAIDAIAKEIENNFNALVGVNWEQIGVYVHEYFNPRKEK